MANYASFADNELTALLLGGDHAAFTEIYQRYSMLLYLHARHMLRDEEQARDVVQEVFVGIWNRHSELQLTTSLNAYLYKAVRNHILNLIRHDRVKQAYLTQFGKLDGMDVVETDERVRLSQLKALIEQEVAAMPGKMREIFELSRNQGLSHAEIGEQLGISPLTVKKQMSRAVGRMRKKFSLFTLLFFHVLP